MLKRKAPLKAIRAFCLDCCGSSSKEVELCTANPADIKKAKTESDETEYQGCPLYEFRFGKNPARKGLGGPGKPFVAKKICAHDASDEIKNEPKDNQ